MSARRNVAPGSALRLLNGRDGRFSVHRNAGLAQRNNTASQCRKTGGKEPAGGLGRQKTGIRVPPGAKL